MTPYKEMIVESTAALWTLGEQPPAQGEFGTQQIPSPSPFLPSDHQRLSRTPLCSHTTEATIASQKYLLANQLSPAFHQRQLSVKICLREFGLLKAHDVCPQSLQQGIDVSKPPLQHRSQTVDVPCQDTHAMHPFIMLPY